MAPLGPNWPRSSRERQRRGRRASVDRRLRHRRAGAGVRDAALRLRRDASCARRCGRIARRSRRCYEKSPSSTHRRPIWDAGSPRSMAEERLGMDVVSGGELAVARVGRVSRWSGCSSTATTSREQELREAIEARVGRIVVDNFHEIDMLDAIAGAAGVPASQRSSACRPASIRTRTPRPRQARLDVKFGFSMETAPPRRRSRGSCAKPNIDVLGLHFHLGSPIFELEPFRQANDVMIAFAQAYARRHGLELREYNSGGGFAAQYVRDQPPPTPDAIRARVVDSLREALEREQTAGAAAVRGAGPSARRASGRRALHRRRAQGDARHPHLRLGRRRHGRQHPSGDVRLALRSARRESSERRGRRSA